MELVPHTAEPRTDEALVVDSLRWIVHGLRVTSHETSRDLGLSGAQLFVLRELAAEPGMSIRRLSERTLTDPSSVSVVVARLVERGFVARRTDPNDARRTVLSLAARGVRLVEKAAPPYQVRLIEALRTLPAARLRQLRLTLTEIVRSLGDGATPAPMFFASDEGKKRSVRAKSARKGARRGA
jgi:DNA-binding MarR family transcriptional regulator